MRSILNTKPSWAAGLYTGTIHMFILTLSWILQFHQTTSRYYMLQRRLYSALHIWILSIILNPSRRTGILGTLCANGASSTLVTCMARWYDTYDLCVVLLIYDYFLTLSDEVELVWCKRFSWPKLLFICNRYIPILAMFANTGSFSSGFSHKVRSEI